MAKLKRFSGTPVSEGVRLEVGKYTVFAVRNAKKDISVRMRREPRVLLRACMRIPFLRGITRLLRDIHRFFDGLAECAEMKPHRPVRGTKADRAVAKLFRAHPQSVVTLWSALLVPVTLLIALVLAPEGAEAMLGGYLELTRAQLNGLVCAVRILGVLISIWTVCRLPVFKRLGMYKGALNKVINCYECRDEISLDNAALYPIHTRRSEPAFLISVLILSMVFFCMVPVQNVLMTALWRVLIVLGVAAALNEPFAALEGADMTLPVRIARTPIDLLQHMTTLEPDRQMLEVAACAFDAVLGSENEEVNKD